MATNLDPSSYPPGYLEQDLGVRIYVTGSVFLFLATGFVALRFYARHLGKVPLGLDDYLMIPTWLSFVGLCTNDLLKEKIVGSRHTAYLLIYRPEQLALVPKFILVASVLGLFSNTFCKLSVLYLFFKIFKVEKAMRYWCYFLSLALVILFLVTFFGMFTICVPTRKLWEPDVPGVCQPLNNAYRWGTFSYIFFDVALLILPFPFLWKLQLSFRVKFGIGITLATGCVGLVTAIVRLITMFRSDFETDYMYNCADSVCVVLAELGTCIMAACMLTFGPLSKVVNVRPIMALFPTRWRHTSDTRSPLETASARSKSARCTTSNDRGLLPHGDEEATLPMAESWAYLDRASTIRPDRSLREKSSGLT